MAHHILAAAPQGNAIMHTLGVIWGFILKFIKFIGIALIVGILLWRGGLNWIHALIMLALGMLLVVSFLPQKAVSFIGQVNQGGTVKSTGATIGELVALGALFALTIYSSRG